MKIFKHRQSGNTVSLIYILAVVGSSLNKKDKHFTWGVGNIARTVPAKIQKGVILVWRAKQWEQWEMSFGCFQAGMVLRSRIFGENIVCRHDMDTYMTLKEFLIISDFIGKKNPCAMM